MTFDRIHVYELTGRLDRAVPWQVHAARVFETGGPLEPGTDVIVCVLDVTSIGKDVLDTVVAACGVARKIDSRAVAAPLDFGTTGEGLKGGKGKHRRFWWVCRNEEGRILDALLTHVGAFPDALSESLAKQAAEAIATAHAAGLSPVVPSPERLLIRDDSSVVLLDPGLGTLAPCFWAAEGAPTPSQLCAAPEQLVAHDKGDTVGARGNQQSDLYALGAMLFRSMTGTWHRPHGCVEEFSEVAATAPPRRPTDEKPRASLFLSEVVNTLLAVDPSDRFESFDALLGVLSERRSSRWWAGLHIAQETVAGGSTEKLVPHDELPPLPIPDRGPALTPEWIAERVARSERLAPHGAPPVGLDRQLEVLAEAAFTLPSGGEVILLRGAAGCGKTRLLDAFFDRLSTGPAGDPDSRPLVLFGEYSHLGIGRPLQAFSQAVTSWLGPDREVETDQVARLLGDATAIAERFAAFLSGRSTEGHEPLARESLASAFRAVLANLSQHRPVVFAVENLHWADPEGLDLFGYLARVAADLPVLLVASHRPVSSGSPLGSMMSNLLSLPHVSAVDVPPLDAETASRLAQEFVQPQEAAAALGLRVHAALGGAPQMMEGVVHLLAAEGSLGESADGTFRAGDATAAANLPGSPDELFARRLASLPQPSRDYLATASVQGPAFDVAVVRRAVGADPGEAQAALAALHEGRFVVGEGPARRFSSHALYQYMYDALAEDVLAHRHQATADAFLASRNPNQLPPSEVHGILSFRVAWHYLQAGSPGRGLLYVPVALAHLRETWRIGDAERLSARAAQSLRAEPGHGAGLVDVLLSRGELLGVQGRREEQGAALEEGLLKAREIGDKVREARVLLASANLSLLCTRLSSARAEGRECLIVAQQAKDRRIESRCHFLLGRVAFEEGRYQDARQSMQRVLELARQLFDAAAEAEALQALGSISQGVGSFEHAEELQRAAMNLYRKTGDLAHEGETLNSLGNIAAASGDYVKAEGCLRRAMATFRALADGYGEARTLGHLGMVLQDSGRFIEARQAHERCLVVSKEMGAFGLETVARLNLATTQYVLGHLDAARDHYGDALRGAREGQDDRLMGYALTGLGDVARQRGEWEVSLGLFRRAVRKFRKVEDGVGLAAALLASGRAQLMAGDQALAETQLKEAVELATPRHARVVTALAQGHLALLRARQGAGDEAQSRMAQAGALVHDVRGAELSRVELHFVHGLVLRVLGRRREADRMLLQAKRVLDDVVAGLPDEDRTALLANITPLREIVAGAEAAATGVGAGGDPGSDTVEV